MPTIVVCVKHVPDTWSERTLNPDFTLHREGVDEVIDEINEYAVEQALQLKEANPDYRVVALTMGTPRAEEALRKALAMGCDDAAILTDDALAGSDVLGTSWALNSAINALGEDVALVVTGNASSDGSMGAVPGILAEYRAVPALTNLTKVAIEGTTITGTREDTHGEYELSAQLPAVVSVTEKSGKPRFPNFKGIMAAKKKEIRTLSLAETGATAEQVGLAHAATAVRSADTRPERTQGTITRGASAPTELVDFLAERGLI
ncbi:electron transfer flavoprotein subunit beta/FixA family protein [Corynebacterium aquilae]|uniref:Electron transfer flavoprotein subunit beta n=1 Tax=Corynebacterium aquilae DSM 44791 TaxID=1431546 RepID=A0A1L7CFG5_9CORY|nr:electron transfer flavoprotein subunit beta/FixA family protein [Corynebacterium aquilae]APT84577.1 electron transfer flavoprotein subunit beta [Corynebacterium aquilae DSM 44791]